MASKKTLVRNLLNVSKSYSPISVPTRIRPAKSAPASYAGYSGLRRRFLHKSTLFSPEILPRGASSMIEKLLTLSNNRIRFDEMLPPPTSEKTTTPGVVTVEDVKKLMRAAEMEIVKSRLRDIGENWITYSEFVRVCGENNSDHEQANRVANTLDQSGNVIVLGNLVCLKPEELTNAVAGLIPMKETTGDDADTRQELEQLEITKSEIDKRADDLVRRELWAGLGFIMAQTIGLFRLTFWELSWDVMEPICYCATSTYFMAAYAFFLRTSKEPSFQAFYQSRFDSKQTRLFQLLDFDINRFLKLQNKKKLQHPKFTHYQIIGY